MNHHASTDFCRFKTISKETLTVKRLCLFVCFLLFLLSDSGVLNNKHLDLCLISTYTSHQ